MFFFIYKYYFFEDLNCSTKPKNLKTAFIENQQGLLTRDYEVQSLFALTVFSNLNEEKNGDLNCFEL